MVWHFVVKDIEQGWFVFSVLDYLSDLSKSDTLSCMT